jgi:hypothetical protein
MISDIPNPKPFKILSHHLVGIGINPLWIGIFDPVDILPAISADIGII